MPIAALPWWPPSGYDGLAEDRVRQLFSYLRTVTRPVMADGERRIREIIGPNPSISIHHETVKSLTSKRLGTFDVLKVIQLSAGAPFHEYHVRFLIGLHRDAALMITPNLNPATHLVWERWAPPNPPRRGTVALTGSS